MPEEEENKNETLQNDLIWLKLHLNILRFANLCFFDEHKDGHRNTQIPSQK
jgi:hypothetical protein